MECLYKKNIRASIHSLLQMHESYGNGGYNFGYTPFCKIELYSNYLKLIELGKEFIINYNDIQSIEKFFFVFKSIIVQKKFLILFLFLMV